MIEQRIGDLLEQKDVNVYSHVCNLHHAMAAGIAKIIKQKYPEAFEADKATSKDDPAKLGTFSLAKTSDDKIVVNIYAMPRMGELSYDALYKALVTLRDKCEVFNAAPNPDRVPKAIGLPHGIGCALAGGDFYVVSAIIKSVFDKSPLKVVICRLPSQPELESCFVTSTTGTTSASTPAPVITDEEVF